MGHHDANNATNTIHTTFNSLLNSHQLSPVLQLPLPCGTTRATTKLEKVPSPTQLKHHYHPLNHSITTMVLTMIITTKTKKITMTIKRFHHLLAPSIYQQTQQLQQIHQYHHHLHTPTTILPPASTPLP